MADNMLFKSITSEDLSKLITEKLGFTVNISNPLKLCDLKPAFGHIFSDHLENYDYWGYCDLDLVTGNLKKYVHPLYEAGVDVISFYKSFLSGPLCLFKKSTHTLELYKKVQGYRAILMDPAYMAMDENNKSEEAEIARFSNLKARVQYLKYIFSNRNLRRSGFQEIRYRYQWFIKRKSADLHPPYDMTDVVFQEKTKDGLSTYFNDLMYSDRAYQRINHKYWTIKWENGKLYELRDNREIPVFHFVELKSKLNMTRIVDIDLKAGFSLDKEGLHFGDKYHQDHSDI
ncbi:MAG TPA: hypothetical protein ENI20_13245 [Bacteroides sp.]|nr:hypothetical protein [Bacteroides sp.]